LATNPDFKDLFAALSARGADFLVVGAHAVAFHSAPRYTKDLDIWVRPTRENAIRVMTALRDFGAPMADLTLDDLATPGTVFQMGVEPNRIDILTRIEGVEFEAAWAGRQSSAYGDVPISVLGLTELIANKRTLGRPQDLLDVARLEKQPRKP
jgi:hypothetical protein